MSMRFPQAATLARHAISLRVAQNSWTRFRGLMLAPPLATEPLTQALLITRCPSVHSFFMRYAIDVVYLNAQYTVTHTACLKPWRVSIGRGSAHALELPAGSIQRLQIQAGDELAVHS